MTIAIIAAVGKNRELGKNNDLIWHFREDMRFFKETTMNHSIIMGRKTFDSLPHALPGRKNIVLTRDKDYSPDGAFIAADKAEALAAADTDEIFVIGGASVYSQFLPEADKLYLTEIDAEDESADVFFPEFDKTKYKKTIIKQYTADGTAFRHTLYEKKN